MGTLFESGRNGRDSSGVEVKKSCFRNIMVRPRKGIGVLISGSGIGREGVIGSLIKNVSVEEEEMDVKRRGIKRGIFREESIISDSCVIGVENGIYGVIVSGIMDGNNGRGYSFISSNNTFVECYRNISRHYVEMNEEYKNTKYISRISLSNASSHTITNCTFTKCSTSTTDVSEYPSSCGGALSFLSSSDTPYRVSITGCIFTSCTAYGWGGAVECLNASWCVVSGCSFDHCRSTYPEGGGGMEIERISSCVGVKDSNISFCSAGWGGGIYIYGSYVTDCEGGVEYGIVSGCIFSDCNATVSSSGGGGIDLSYLSLSTIRSCYIYRCHAPYGGGICWDSPTLEQIALSEWILHCVFENNSASRFGHDVYFYSESYNRSDSIFDEMSYTLTNQDWRVSWYYSTNTYSHSSWLPYGPPFDGSIYVNPSLTSSSTSCGRSVVPCGSLSKAMESSYYGNSKFTGVMLMEGVHKNDEKRISVGENSLPITSKGVVELDVPSTFSSTSNVFEISNGILNMSVFVIEMKKNLGSGCHLIYINGGGSVIMSSMKIRGGSRNYGTSDSPLLYIGSRGSVISKGNVTFENIGRLSGNGTIFEFISLFTSFSLSNMTFTNCKSLNGSGGYTLILFHSRIHFVIV